MDPQASRNTLQLSEQKADAVNPEAAVKSSQAVGSNQPLYFPLVEAQIIRLVELAPGARDAPVVIRLFITELEHHPEYDAISYVWGNPEDTLPVLCNGRSFDITVNLNAAFVRVRYGDRPRILWADAVCMYSYRTATNCCRNLRFRPRFCEGFGFVSERKNLCSALSRKNHVLLYAELFLLSPSLSGIYCGSR
jgi:hypothetical protein